MPTVKIDGREFEFEKGDKLLQFCLDRGVEIPHFCYHPALSVPANCRQCLVKAGTPLFDRATREPVLDESGQQKINYFPKMMPSCALDLSDGMVVHTQEGNEEVAAAQADNLELLLINHPLDCPICDQAGQCPLQIQAYKYGPEGSRFEFEKVHKPKRVELGPHVMLDAERCINCTRCTRFTSEVSESHQLSIVNRGDKNYPLPPPGQPFDDPYSMCTTDICPVGALTERYFRFGARVWEMSKTPSVSAYGAKGINVDYWVRDNLVLRITPRQNAATNGFWMPDAARLVFETYNENRPAGPSLTYRDGERGAATWRQAYDGAALLLKDADPSRVLFVGSPFATTEDNYLLQKLAAGLGASAPVYVPRREDGSGDDWLISDDPAPNAAACEMLGFAPADAQMLRSRLQSGEIQLIYSLEDDPIASGLFTADDLAGDVRLILHHTHATDAAVAYADVAFPAAMCVETIGTYVSEDGHAQRLRPAKAVKSVNRQLMLEMGQSRLDRQGTPFDRWHNEDHKIDCLPGWTVLPQIAERLKIPMRYAGPAAIMDELAEQNPAFAGATFAAMATHGVALTPADGVDSETTA